MKKEMILGKKGYYIQDSNIPPPDDMLDWQMP